MSYTTCSRFKGEHIVYAGYTICTSREHIVYGAFYAPSTLFFFKIGGGGGVVKYYVASLRCSHLSADL